MSMFFSHFFALHNERIAVPSAMIAVACGIIVEKKTLSGDAVILDDSSIADGDTVIA